MALVNNVLVSVVVLVVSVRVESLNVGEKSFSYNPDSIAENEKILRLFIQLASETANHLIRLKRGINVHQESRLNHSKLAVGTKVPVGAKRDLNDLGMGLGVGMAKKGQRQSNNSAVPNGTSNVKSSSEKPIEIANRMISDAKQNKTGQAVNVTNVPKGAVQLSPKAEKQLAVPVNGTDGIVGQSGIVENGTGGMVSSTVVPSSTVSQASMGQLSRIPTVPSSTSKPQSGLNGQGGEKGNGTLTPPTVVPSSSVRPVQIGGRSNVPTVPNTDFKTQSGLNNQSGKMGNGTAGILQKPPIQNSQNNQLSPAQSTINRDKQLDTKNSIAPSVPMNPGLPINPSQVIPPIPSIMNGTIGTLMLSARDTGSKFLGPFNGVASSLSQTPFRQVNSNTKGSIDAGAQVAGILPIFRSIPNPIDSTTSVPSTGPPTVPTNPGSPAGASQMISPLQNMNEKMGKMLSVDSKNPGDPKDPYSMMLKNPSAQALGQLDYAKNQVVGNLMKGVNPMFRSFPDTEGKSPGNNKSLNATTKRVEKNGTVDKTQLDSAASNDYHNELLESELHDYVNKFLDALRPLDSGRSPATKSLAIK